MSDRLAMTFFDPETGRISGGGVAPLDDLIANLPDGHLMLPGEWSADLWWIRDGAAVARPDPVPVSLGPDGLAIDPALPPETRYYLAPSSGSEM